MALINITNLTFAHEGGENLFERVSLQLDTSWRLGLIGRNGRGKTTFLELLMGRYEYSGSIASPLAFDYFPFAVEDGGQAARSVALGIAPGAEGRKGGFILVSHDRRFLDGCVDHVMLINRAGIELQRGNFSSWQDNRARQDGFEQAQNRKLKKEIKRLVEHDRAFLEAVDAEIIQL